MRNRDEVRTYHAPVANSGTRDAVETAIDRAKGDKSSTWETLTEVSKAKGITHWQEASEPSNAQDDPHSRV